MAQHIDSSFSELSEKELTVLPSDPEEDPELIAALQESLEFSRRPQTDRILSQLESSSTTKPSSSKKSLYTLVSSPLHHVRQIVFNQQFFEETQLPFDADMEFYENIDSILFERCPELKTLLRVGDSLDLSKLFTFRNCGFFGVVDVSENSPKIACFGKGYGDTWGFPLQFLSWTPQAPTLKHFFGPLMHVGNPETRFIFADVSEARVSFTHDSEALTTTQTISKNGETFKFRFGNEATEKAVLKYLAGQVITNATAVIRFTSETEFILVDFFRISTPRINSSQGIHEPTQF